MIIRKGVMLVAKRLLAKLPISACIVPPEGSLALLRLSPESTVHALKALASLPLGWGSGLPGCSRVLEFDDFRFKVL